MNSQNDIQKKKNAGRQSSSKPAGGGNTPGSSPSLARKSLHLKTGNKELKPSENPTINTSTIDVERISDASNLLEVTTVLTKSTSALTQCPCDMLDRKCIAIKCTHCNKDWHTECCNLSGVTPSVARKLEGQSWKCPWCYQPTICNPKTETVTKDHLDELGVSMSRVQQCTEDLNENASVVEFFNQHIIKHLLLDDSKFKAHSEKLDKLSQIAEDNAKSLATVKNQLSDNTQALNSVIQLKTAIEQNSKLINDGIHLLQHQITVLSQAPKCECNELLSSIDKQLESVQKEEINLNQEKIVGMQGDITEMTKAISSMQQQMTTNQSEVKEQLTEFLTNTSVPTQLEPTTTSCSFPQEKIDSISNRLDELSNKVSDLNIQGPEFNISTTNSTTPPTPNTISHNLR